MARRRAKKTVKKSASPPLNGANGANGVVETQAQIEKDEVVFKDQEGMPFCFWLSITVIFHSLCLYLDKARS